MPLYRYRTDKQIDDAISAATGSSLTSPVPVADGGTGATDAATARTNLGLAIGTDVQAYDADLATWAGVTPSANGQSLVSAADYAAMRGLLDLEAGTDFYSKAAADAAFQPLDADLTTWAGLTPSANAQSLVTAANYAAMRGLLDLEAGTDFYSKAAADAAFQPLDAGLTDIAALAVTDGNIIVGDGANWVAESGATARASLGLTIGTHVQAYDADLTTWAGLTPSANAQSLVTAANYAAMRTLLDLEAGTDFYSIAAADAAFQPKDADLTALAGLTSAADKVPYFTGSGTAALADFSSYGRTLVALADETALEAVLDTLPNVTSIQGRTVTLADAGANAIFGWDDTAGAYENLTAAEATAVLSAFVGDSGSGGTKGLVPAPASGDASKFLSGDGTFKAIPGGGDALVANPLSQFAATTSLQLKGVMSDETGSGALVFADTPTLVTPILGTPTSGTLTNCTGLPLAGGGTGASLADPNADRIMFWDDSAGAVTWLSQTGLKITGTVLSPDNMDLIADTASTTGSTVTFSNIGTYDSFVAIFRSVSTSGTTGQISVQVSDDGTNYGTAMNVGTTLANAGFAHIGQVWFYMTGEAATTKYMAAHMQSGSTFTNTNGTEATENGVTTHIKFTTSAGTFDSGAIALLGFHKIA